MLFLTTPHLIEIVSNSNAAGIDIFSLLSLSTCKNTYLKAGWYGS